MKFFVALFLTLSPGHMEMVIPKTCAKSIAIGKNFECSGRDKEHLVCRGIIIEFSEKCTEVRVVKGE